MKKASALLLGILILSLAVGAFGAPALAAQAMAYLRDRSALQLLSGGGERPCRRARETDGYGRV